MSNPDRSRVIRLAEAQAGMPGPAGERALVEARDLVQLLFLIVQADNWSSAFCVLRTDAAQINRESHARFCCRSSEAIGNPVLVAAQVLL
jgi:hypothetical protein